MLYGGGCWQGEDMPCRVTHPPACLSHRYKWVTGQAGGQVEEEEEGHREWEEGKSYMFTGFEVSHAAVV